MMTSMSTGDLAAFTCVGNSGHKYVVASFHGDTNGLASIPIVKALSEVSLSPSSSPSFSLPPPLPLHVLLPFPLILPFTLPLHPSSFSSCACTRVGGGREQRKYVTCLNCNACHVPSVLCHVPCVRDMRGLGVCLTGSSKRVWTTHTALGPRRKHLQSPLATLSGSGAIPGVSRFPTFVRYIAEPILPLTSCPLPHAPHSLSLSSRARARACALSLSLGWRLAEVGWTICGRAALAG